MWLFYLIFISELISFCIGSYWLYKSFKCDKLSQFSCRNEKCLLRGMCDKYRPSDEEIKKIREMIDKM